MPSTFPRGGKRGIGGKRADIGNTYFRSRWEANWARYLNFLVKNKQILKWRYEPKTFEFVGIKKGSRFYTPDFLVTDLAGREHFEEVKGYMNQSSATKLRRMKKYHPDVEVRLIDKEVYQSIAKTMKRILPHWEFTK